MTLPPDEVCASLGLKGPTALAQPGSGAKIETGEGSRFVLPIDRKEVKNVTTLETQPRQIARWDLSFAYLMTGVTLGCIWLSYILAAIFAPDMVTGSQHQHFQIEAVVGWSFVAIATGLVMAAALRGIRAKVTDKAPWTVLGIGVSAIWFTVMFVVIFAPVWVTGTDPDRIPGMVWIAGTAGVILTWIFCHFMKTAFFQPAPTNPGTMTITPAVGLDSVADDATLKLRQLAQLRDSGVITEADFEAKKSDLLSRI
jgi:Short C-terminal domain